MTIKQIPQVLVPAALAVSTMNNLQVTGNYIRTPSLQAPGSTTAVNQQTYYTPVYLSGISFDRISCQTFTSFSGTASVRLGIYNADPRTGKPTTVYLDAGTVSCTASNTIYEITISITPPAGLYWLAFCSQTNAATNNFYATGTGNNALASSNRNMSGTNADSYWTQTGVSGAFATAGTLSIVTNAVHAALRMA